MARVARDVARAGEDEEAVVSELTDPPYDTRDISRPYQTEAEVWFQHVRRGGIYRVLGVGNLQIEDKNLDMEIVVVYQDVKSNRLWVRPAKEFYDGRFMRVPS